MNHQPTATDEAIDARARQMSDDERDATLVAAGWQFVGAGWIPPVGPEDQAMGSAVQVSTSGLYSMSVGIREQLARENPDAVPNELGRYWHGSAPANSFGRRW
jgi:hypothetical protein